MLEKLVKGRYLTFSYSPVPKVTYALGDFLTQPKMALTIEQSTREKLGVPKWNARTKEFVREGPKNQMKMVNQRQRVSTVSPGENLADEKVHRNFQWLRYYGGAVNQVRFDNLDVLSGDFSGCWMMVYKKDGVEYVGHVGTVEDLTKPHSVEAKKAWNDFAQHHQGDVLRGFNPARTWTDPATRPNKIDGDGVPRIWGLVTETQLISVFLYRQEKDWDRYRIGDWKVVDPEHPPQLCNI